MHRIILLGPPGAGKGTQAHWIEQQYHIPCIATGEMLRAAIKQNSALGLQAKHFMEQGALVPDTLVITLIRHRILRSDCQQGFLLDGFPRTLAQATTLRTDQIPIDVILELKIADEIVIERLSGRRIHPASGRIYHIRHQKPKISGKDDITGEPLIQRTDDLEETIRKRLAVYHQQTQPLLEYYKGWWQSGDRTAPTILKIDGNQEIAIIREKIFAKLKTLEFFRNP